MTSQPVNAQSANDLRLSWLHALLAETVRQWLDGQGSELEQLSFRLELSVSEAGPPATQVALAEGGALLISQAAPLLKPGTDGTLEQLLTMQRALRRELDAFVAAAALAGPVPQVSPAAADPVVFSAPITTAPGDPLLGVLERQLSAVYAFLQEQAGSGLLAGVLAQVFGVDPAAAGSQQLLTQLEQGQPLPVALQLLDEAALAGYAAYSAGQGGEAEAILVNRQWLATATPEQLFAVLLEEVGHAVDQRLNQGLDTAGDEGRRFAEQLLGGSVELLLPRGTSADADDHGVVLLNGEEYRVEYATLVNTIAAFAEVDQSSGSYANLFNNNTTGTTWSSLNSFAIRITNAKAGDVLVFDIQGVNIDGASNYNENIPRFGSIKITEVGGALQASSGSFSAATMAANGFASGTTFTTGIQWAQLIPTNPPSTLPANQILINFTIGANNTLSNTKIKDHIANSLAFYHVGSDPGPSRTITFFNSGFNSTSGANTSTNRATTVSITEINDKPLLSASKTPVSFTEGAGLGVNAAVRIFSGVTASPVEAAQFIRSFTIRISGEQISAYDELNYGSNDTTWFSLNSDLSAALAISGFAYDVEFNATTKELKFTRTALDSTTGGLNATETKTFIESIQYRNTSDAPLPLQRSFWISNIVDSGPNTGSGNTTENSDGSLTQTIVHVTGTNDRPVLVNSFSPDGFTIKSSATDTINTGYTVANLLPTINVTDPDGGITPGIAVSGVTTASSGAWEWRGAGLNAEWREISFTVENFGKILLLGPNDRVRYNPNNSGGDSPANSSATLIFAAWDQSNSAAIGSYVPADDSGTSPYSSRNVTLTASIVLNTPPVLSPVQPGSIAEVPLSTNTTGTGLSGTLSATDVDNDSITYGIVDGSPGSNGTVTREGIYGVLTLNTSTGFYSYIKTDAAVEALSADSTAVDGFTITADDSDAPPTTQTYTVNLTGANDAPIVSFTDVTGAVTELLTPAGNLTDSGTLSFSDVDLTDSHSISTVTPSAGALGTLTANVSTQASDTDGNGGVITWNYSVAASAVEYLAKDQTKVESFTFNVLDGNGGSIERTVSVTITGTNDAVTITALGTDGSGSVTEDASDTTLSSTGSIAFNDIDLIDVHSTSVAKNSGTLGGTLTMGTVSESATTEPGTVGWTYQVNNSAVQYLANGETTTESFTVTISDGQGSSATQTVNVTVTGTNDNPVITSELQSGDVKEDTLLSATGTITAEDIDNVLSTDLVFSGNATGSYGSFSVDATSGAWSYSLDNGTDGTNSAVQDLAEGETRTEFFTVTVTDEFGATDTQTATVTITGTNDAPVATFTTAQSATEDGAPISGSLTSTDVDSDARPTYFLMGDQIPGLSISSDGSWAFDPSDDAYDSLSKGELLEIPVTYVARDSHGASDTETFVINVTGVNDDVDITSAPSIQEINGNQLDATGTIFFSDVDLFDAHSFAIIDQPDPADSIGSFSVDSMASPIEFFGGDGQLSGDGQLNWSYQVDEAKLASLAPGDTRTHQYVVEISDGNGSFASQAVTITIRGDNQAPQVSISKNLTTLTYSDKISADALSYTALDPDGQSVTATFSIEREESGSWTSVGGFTGVDAYGLDQYLDSGFVGSSEPISFQRESLLGVPGGYRWSLQGHSYLPVGHYRIQASFSDGTSDVPAEAIPFRINAESLSTNWAAAPIVRTNVLNSDGSATGSLPIRVVIKENDLTPGGLNAITYGGSFNPSNLKIQVIDQYSGRLLASTDPGSGVALLTIADITPTDNATGTVLTASANLIETLQAGEQSRHYLLRTIVSGKYYNHTTALDNTLASLSRPNGQFSAVTDNLSSNGGYSISGIAADLLSTTGSRDNRMFSAELTGQLPTITGVSGSQNGNFLLRSTVINSVLSSNFDSNSDGIIDYRSVIVQGTASLFPINRAVTDLITGSYETGSPTTTSLASGINFRARFLDYDVASGEPFSGLYNSTEESRNGVGTAGTAMDLVDLVDLVAYQPGSTSSLLFGTIGNGATRLPVKSYDFSPINETDPLYPYQPNVWI